MNDSKNRAYAAVNGLRVSASKLKEILDVREVKNSQVREDYSPSSDKTFVTLLVEFEDEKAVDIVCGFYYGKPNAEDTEYFFGKAVCLLEP